jgi:PAS domain S-box-containing protein
MEGKEQAVRPESQLFYNAFRASPIGIALEDLEARPLYVNPALCSMLGFSEEELLNKHCVDFSPAEDAEKDWALFQQLKSGSINHYNLDKRYFRRDGSLFWGRLSISLLKDSASLMVVAMVEDITEQKKAQEAMLRAQHDLDVVTKEMAVAAARCSRDFRYLWANQGYADVLQRPLDEIVGQPIANVLGAETFGALRHYFERVLAGEVVTYEQEVHYPRVGCKSILATYTPTFGTDGRVDGWVAVGMDITQRKQAEEALSKVSQKLIQAQEHERSRLARELHDDINQRLSLLAIALDRLKHELPPAADQLKQHISAASEQAADIGKDIQGLSHRLHSPKLELLGLAAAASSFCKEFSQRQNVEIDFESANIPRNLPDDISLTLYRVLQEALQNAVKHSGSGHFRVSLTAETNEIELAVQDSGVGFEPGEAIKGRGLGLASMKERMKLVAGELSISSQLQQGTTIRARVPFDPRSKAAGASGSK